MLTKLFVCVIALTISSSEGTEHNAERRATYSNKKPIVTGFELINTVKQEKITDVNNGMKIDICKLAHIGIHSPDQLNFRAVTTATQSVDFSLNHQFYRRDDAAFFSLCGDKGGYPYFGCKDLKYGHQCISAIPWSLPGGKGLSGDKVKVCFDVVGCPPVRAPVPVPVPVRMPVPAPVPVLPPPSVVSFELINTVKQDTIRTLMNGETIDICKLRHVGIHEPNQLNFRAVTKGNVESVEFSKNSKFFRTDNAAFYSLCGDNAGFPYRKCDDLSLGFQCISAKPCTMDNGGGICGRPASICFNIIGCPSPTPSPIKSPTRAPVSTPTKAPISPPSKAPIRPPTKAPISPPTKAPISPPTKAPIRSPTKAPIRRPTNAPIRPPTKAPFSRPTHAPIRHPTKAPISRPTYAPIRSNTRAPIKRIPTKSPVDKYYR